MEAMCKPIIVAAVDLGSNSFRLLVARISDGEISPLSKILVPVGLGQGLLLSGIIEPDAIEKGLSALEKFRKEMDRYSLDHQRCCGTEALRKATNRSSFLARAAAIIDTEVDILSGDREAALSCKGALQAIEGEPSFPLLVVDVGGSSTEMTFLTTGGAPLLTTSIPTGAVSFKELSEKESGGQAREGLANELKAFKARAPIRSGKTAIIATGGTATSLASLALDLKTYDEKKVHGHQLGRATLCRLAEELGGMSASKLHSLPGMEPGRGNILPAGLEIYQEIIATIDAEGMIVSDAGLLEGIALSCTDRA
jgi:exopolyphosphatase/guanosine-5'-triphosphate,3'-diphosphate pyrophosphatase